MDAAHDATLRASLALLGADEATPCEPRHTLAHAPTLAGVSPPSAPSPFALPRLRVTARETSDPAAELLTTATLGRGGMGVVHLAQQRSLGRDVAVKMALEGDGTAAASLVREARIMGGLEHPSVVPVHALGLTEGGDPVLVMKRVEGVTWAALLAEPEHPAWEALLAGHGDRLRANVEVLAQVARALAFAHARGVLHRDLKPDNVMLGAFGEVYLLDWGLALRLEERSIEARRIVGTPGYMPPEMARGDASKLGERTDVYLLGATLYELLCGRVPHEAPTVMGALASSLLGLSPPLPENTPRELARLVQSALALDVEERPASAEAFRQELAAYLASRASNTLALAAGRAIDEAESLVAREGLADPSVARPLHEARFALKSARLMLGSDRRDEALEALLDRCTRRLIAREVALRSPGGARGYLEELGDPTDEDRAPIDALERTLADERSTAEAAARAAQASSLASSSSLVVPLIAVAAALTVAFSLTRQRQSRDDAPVAVLTQSLAVYAVMAVVMWVLRRRVLATPGARRVVAFMLLWYSYPVPLALLAIGREQPVFDWGTALIAGTLLAAVGSVEILPGLWPTVPLHAAATVLIARWPERFALFFNGMLVLNGAIIVRALRTRIRAAQKPPGA